MLVIIVILALLGLRIWLRRDRHRFYMIGALVSFGLIALFGWFLSGGFFSSINVSDDGLSINIPMYGRDFSWRQIQAKQARVIDLNHQGPLRPDWRTNGLGLPGYQLGWFKLTNQQRALVALSQRENVLMVPTTEDYLLLISLDQANEAAALIQQMGGE